jgi:MFS transporter, FHS family, glucose/mannose:H+ symporter
VSTNSTEILPDVATDPRVRDWIAGFLLVGLLLGLLGSLLIAWQYHIETAPELIGVHFLALNAGYVVAAAIAQRILGWVSIRSVALFSCAIASASLLALSLLAPPVSALWRLLALALVGVSGGALATALLYVLEPYYDNVPASAASMSGVLFGCGCLLATVVTGITYFTGSIQILTVPLAAVPLFFLAIYAKNRYPPALVIVRRRHDTALESLRDLRSIAAVLFSLLLFFQFGNEWAIAGWLPLFLIHRLGSNPGWAIFALAVYFLALLLGRLASRGLLLRVNHRRLLLAGVVFAMLGYLLLSFTDSLLGAFVAIVLIGAGFGPVYPLIAETLDERFKFHPAFYNGIFSVAITGAMSAPWILGYVDAYLGIGYVMFLPALGSVAVFILALLIMLEAHLMGAGGRRDSQSPLIAGKE